MGIGSGCPEAGQGLRRGPSGFSQR